MIKKLTFILLAASCMQSMYYQNTEKNEKCLENKTLFEELTNVKKKQDKFNLFLNMQGSFDANFRNGFEEGAFKMRQLRIEAKGNLNNWLSYRYRQRLNRSNDSSGNIDNLPTSIDIAGIGVKLGKGFSIFAGKLFRRISVLSASLDIGNQHPLCRTFHPAVTHSSVIADAVNG